LENFYTLLVSIFLAIGLSAACGFRIFIPPLLYGVLYKAELVQLDTSWNWIGNDWVISVLFLAAIIEIFGNLIPWVDNLLDILATPTSIMAGTILSASCLSDFSPGLQWILSVTSGVLITGGFQLTTISLRGMSSVFTAGLINPIFSIIEDLISFGITLTIIFSPIIGIIVILFIALLIRKLYLNIKITSKDKKLE
tara:strand:+ start:78 stop:665 length:588 start_codon:yes stop_codon:yes gene_type:complete